MPRKTDSNNPADWLFIAESELTGLQLLVAHETSYVMCRAKLAEVLEKVLKAELIRAGWFLVKTHDLVKLNTELGQREPHLAAELQSLVEELAEAYLTDRYPGFDLDDPDWPSLRRQVQQVAAMLARVRAHLGH